MALIKNPDEYNDPPRPFFEHIVALRSCLVHSMVAWVVCCILAGVFSTEVIGWIQAPAKALEAATGKPVNLINMDFTAPFTLLMSTAMWGGTALSFPFVMYFVLRFIFPALTKKEKVAILFFLTAGAVLFGFGATFAYGQLAPNMVRFFYALSNWLGIEMPAIQMDTYVPVILKLVLAFGLVFQIPLILFVLGWLGVISSDTLRSWRRFAIVLSFFLGMVLTPPDPMSQILMATPLIVLYELSIWGVYFKEVCSGERWAKRKEERAKRKEEERAKKEAEKRAKKEEGKRAKKAERAKKKEGRSDKEKA